MFLWVYMKIIIYFQRMWFVWLNVTENRETQSIRLSYNSVLSFSHLVIEGSKFEINLWQMTVYVSIQINKLIKM